MTQDEAYSILMTGRSVFLTGAAGSGKTFLLNRYIADARSKGASVGITASTGIAATHISGMTIHSWSGIGVRDSMSDNDMNLISARPYLKRRFLNTDILVIDEVSMLHHFRLDLIDRMLRIGRKKLDKPFGGVQVILCGDFFQLPPVSRENEPESKFAYESEAWRALSPVVCYLHEQHRQDDNAYLSVLNAIRGDAVDESIVAHLQTRFKKKPEGEVEPTKLYAHNADVDAENERELAKVPGQLYSYDRYSSGVEKIVETLEKTCLAPAVLRLKVGASVMFVKNDMERRYVNGTLGTVVACSDAYIHVRTARGKIIDVAPAEWTVEDEGRVLARLTQYPLRLAWAITIHKSQGMSMDAAEIDLRGAFEHGMGYVALSRVRTLAGLCLHGLNDKALSVSPDVRNTDAQFQKESELFRQEFAKRNKADIEREHHLFAKTFTDAGGSGAHKKIKKPETCDETRRLLAEGLDVAQIATKRGLTMGTILGHLEKIKAKNLTTDFSHVASAIPKKRFNVMRDALKASKVGPDSKPLLAPAMQCLDSSYSFEELRIVRLCAF
jgi:ATP-dependent exoDNAse (exonuclease V) alpha subunit